MKKSVVMTIIILAYHVGVKSEMTGMFQYAHAHHLHIQKVESVNDMVLYYFNK